ncbi:hypothetical protein GCM10027570_25190 [Streptomonospora sediminis]
MSTYAIETSADRALVTGGDDFVAVFGPTPLEHRLHSAAPAEFALLLDASQSMLHSVSPGSAATRWELARRAAVEFAGELQAESPVHVFVFAHRAQHVSSDQAEGARSSLPGRLHSDPRLYNGNGTNIEAALRQGYAALERSSSPSRRLVLLSDGEPNVGLTGPSHLAGLAGEAARKGVYTDTVGIGAGANIELLSALSATGGDFDHVASSERAAVELGTALSRMAAWGRGAVATGGEIKCEVHPEFAIEGVYQLHPKRRRLDAHVSGNRLACPLGAVGTGEDRPLFALRIRAPYASAPAPVTVVRLRGRLALHSGDTELAAANLTVQPVEHDDTSYDGALHRDVAAIDVEEAVSAELRTSSPGRFAEIYRSACRRAGDAGLSDLAAQYAASLDALSGGQHPNDVRNSQHATSARSETVPQDVLRRRPTVEAHPHQRDDAVQHPEDEWDDDGESREAAPQAPRPSPIRPLRAQVDLAAPTEPGQ